MFKTDLGVRSTLQKLMHEEGWRFMIRGISNNVVAVAAPLALTIFFTDVLISLKHST